MGNDSKSLREVVLAELARGTHTEAFADGARWAVQEAERLEREASTQDGKSASGKPWVIYRCWAGQASTLVPQPTEHKFWTRRAAERFANELTAAMSATGTWFEVRNICGRDVEWVVKS